MKYMFAVGAVAFALTTFTPGITSAQQDTQSGQSQQQQQPGITDRQDTTGTAGTSGMQQGDRQNQQGGFNNEYQNQLPATASPLGLILLGGLGALTGGIALRRARR